MNWTFATLKPGDLIRVRRSFYYHFGIYIGENKVIHFSAQNDDGITNPKDISVRISPFEIFSKNTVVEKAKYTLKEKVFFKRSNKNILKIAHSRLGEQGYNFLRNNCEDFAYSCVFKKKIPTQVDNLKNKVKNIIKHD